MTSMSREAWERINGFTPEDYPPRNLLTALHNSATINHTHQPKGNPMGHRTTKRVPLDFDHPLNEVWSGYLRPDNLFGTQCSDCDGTGYSQRASQLKDRWYGYSPFDPSETGSVPLTVDHPKVRAFAERNVNNAPHFYGTGEFATIREAQRLCNLWNSQWSHHLDADDVAALIEADRLWDLTRTWSREDKWQKIDPIPDISPQQVNEWSIGGFGHDSINCHVVVKAKCKREGVSYTCHVCKGEGSFEAYPGQREDADNWTPTEPPSGPGWQLWETTSEGSPVSPVFESPEVLADWCEDNATWFGSEKTTRDEWLRMFVNDTTDIDTLLVMYTTAPVEDV